MKNGRWQEIDRLYNSALELEPEVRAAYLREACGDESLRREVESLLACQSEAKGFIESPAIEAAAQDFARVQSNQASAALAGHTLSHYRVLEKLGEGGMGVVYKALDTRLNRPVALKVLPPDKVSDPERKRRFVKEARAASALNHPYIVTIYDIGQAEGIDFMAMEYVAGKTLDRQIPRKGLPIAIALNYAIQMADGLAAAHAGGIIHRDLKPSNIMVSNSGQVKVLDFGLAKLVERAEPNGEEDPTVAMREGSLRTDEGMILGTAAYMSPEQAQGKKADARSDIFSFGAVLYQMVSGRRAFQGDGIVSTLAAIVRDEPTPLTEIVPDLPAELDRILRRCLRKNPDRRWQTMSDMRVALQELHEECERQPAPSVASASPSGRTRRLLGFSALLALPGLALAGWLVLKNSTHQAPAPRLLQLTSYPGNEFCPSFSPDGQQVAFSWNGEKEDNYDIYVKGVEAANALRLTSDPGGEYFPAWSPDGKRIAFKRFKEDSWSLWWVSHLGGVEQKISDLPTRNQLSWSPDGKWLAAGRQFDANNPHDERGIFLVPLEGGEPLRLTLPQAPAFDIDPAFSPDGTLLAFASCKMPYACDLFLQELGAGYVPKGPPRQITHQGLLIAGVAWSRDGKSLVYGGSLSYDITWRLWRTAISGEQPSERLELAGLRGFSPAIAPSGDRLVFSLPSGHANLWRYQIGGSLEPFLKSALTDYDPQFSRDGNKIAFSSDRYGDVLEIWIADADGSHPVQLTRNRGLGQGSPRWSPDGRLIAFDSKDQDGLGHICMMDASGGQFRQVTSGKFSDHVPSFSHDGKWIYFYSNRTGRDEVWRVALATGVLQQLTENGGMQAFESVDGRSIYYRKQMPNRSSRLFIRSLEGGPERQILDDLLFKAFAVSEDGIYYIGIPGSDKQFPLLFDEFATGAKRLIHKFDIQTNGDGLTVSSDRKVFVATQRVGGDTNLMLIENFR